MNDAASGGSPTPQPPGAAKASKIRVVVVDDAITIRHLITRVLDAEEDITVVGTAADGVAAVAKIEQLKPDVVTLDVEMPERDGLETLAALREARIFVPVIMCSTLTARGAQATIDALTLGAADYVTKPSGGTMDESLEMMRAELLPKVRSVAERRRGFTKLGSTPAVARARTLTPPRPAPSSTGRPARLPARPIDIVAIGVSTGGPNALSQILPELPADLEVPIVIVQHMPPMFTTLLAERLDAHCKMRVVEATTPQVLRKGFVYVAPGGRHMVVTRKSGINWIDLNDDKPENSCRPAVDVLFRSVAKEHPGSALAVVLTGMGHDGLNGSQEICSAGGAVIVQDDATSVVWGMPRAVTEAGIADAILPLDAVAGEITARVRRSHAGQLPVRGVMAVAP